METEGSGGEPPVVLGCIGHACSGRGSLDEGAGQEGEAGSTRDGRQELGVEATMGTAPACGSL